MDAAELIDISLKTTHITFLEHRCTRLLGDGCDLCVKACWASLPFSEQDEFLAEGPLERCTDCSACATACPTGAIHPPQDELVQLERTLSSLLKEAPAETVAIACPLARAPEGTGRVIPCIHALRDGAVMLLWSAGFRHVEVGIGSCESCPRAPEAQGLLRARIERLARIAREIGLDRTVCLEERPESTAEASGRPAVPYDRREAIGVLRDRGLSLLRAAANRDPASDPDLIAHGALTPGSPSSDRERVVAALRRMADERSEEQPLELAWSCDERGGVSTAGPRIDRATCIACGDCVRFCPTGALRIRTKEGSWRIVLDSSRCVGCGLCELLCRTDAIEMKTRTLGRVLGKPLRIVSLVYAVCETCGQEFGTAEEALGDEGVAAPAGGRTSRGLCPTCAKQAERFKGFY